MEDSQILLFDVEKYDAEVGLFLKAAEKTENWISTGYVICGGVIIQLMLQFPWSELMVQ